jgi:uncharacterized membrane protein
MVPKEYDTGRQNGTGTRFHEIDTLRGAAVVGMIIYHLLVDLEMFYGYKIGVFEYPVLLLARMVGIIFTILVGMSAQLQYQQEDGVKKIFKRGINLLLWAGVISLVTFILFPQEFIYFGILHMLGTSILLMALLLKIKSNIVLIAVGVLVILIGAFIEIPFRASLDYYPLIPWFGLSILGVVGARIYIPWREKISIRINPSWLSQIGRKTLQIYLIHQPVLLAILWAIKKIGLI